MISFQTVIEIYEKGGDKNGWRYIYLDASQLKAFNLGNKKSFRVRGTIDHLAVQGLATTPVGDGNFILALKLSIRKALKKDVGDVVSVQLALDTDFKWEMPEDLRDALQVDNELYAQFNLLTPSYQSYFIKHIEEAKTTETRIKRILGVVKAMEHQWDFGQMIRESRKDTNLNTF